MNDTNNQQENDLSNISEVELIKRITKSFKNNNKSTIIDIGDDAALLKFDKTNVTISQDILVEGVHFDLSYMPLKHLGYKSVIVNISDIISMNVKPSHILVSIAVSNRFKLDAIQEIYDGINAACSKYNLDLVGGDTTSSNKGLIISVTCIGSIDKKKIVKRAGAKDGDIVFVSGDLGGSYMGLQVLEREKSVFEVNPNSQPDLSEYTYCIQRQLKPEARKDIIKLFKEINILPTSMIDISDGLSSEIIHLAKASKKGFIIYEEKLPIDPEVIKISEEFKLNPLTSALNGGEDYELLFTINQNDYNKIKDSKQLTVIGHVVDDPMNCNLINLKGEQIKLVAQGWKNFEE